MGDTCTRGCHFCNVKTAHEPPPLDSEEPQRVATAIAEWGLSYVVLTSVDRDDIVRARDRSLCFCFVAVHGRLSCSCFSQADQGAGHFASTVRYLRQSRPSIKIECLTPDFRGVDACVDEVARSGLNVFAHNVETVERLQSRVRDHRAGWQQSLKVLQRAKETVPSLITKTSIMLGLGETLDDVRGAMRGIRDAGVDVITFGQYLRPSKRHIALDRYVTPAEFAELKSDAEAMGFLYVASGPLVRSSYKAGEYFLEGLLKAREAGQRSAV
jgi:lipoyl synthase